MSNSDQLRSNKNQHKPKNTKSKKDDKEVYRAMARTISYLEKRFEKELRNHSLVFKKSISFGELIDQIKGSGLRREFDTSYLKRRIKPDGGVIWLKKNNENSMKMLLVAEVKRQGTNDKRELEGKKKQAQGNAIERLGKNLTGIRAALNHEAITPFVCFGHGCDFVEEYGPEHFVMSKMIMLNEYYPLNQIHVFKRDGDSDRNRFSPVSMYFREEDWTEEKMYEVLKEVGETSLRYYLF